MQRSSSIKLTDGTIEWPMDKNNLYTHLAWPYLRIVIKKKKTELKISCWDASTEHTFRRSSHNKEPTPFAIIPIEAIIKPVVN